MPKSKLKKSVRLLQIALSGAVLSGFIGSEAALAAGLGRLNVYSALGQPLRAEIELTALSKDEVSSLAARLAPTEAFRLANIDFNPALSTFRFTIDRDNTGKPVIKVSSSRPLNEPFVDLLVELSWASGKLVREFTFLLDPPENKPNTRVDEVESNNRVNGAALPYSEERTASKPRRQPVSTPVTPAESAEPATDIALQSGKQYLVKPGDTLTGIATQFQESTLSLNKTVAALYRANPSAFIGGNINLIRSGASLALPVAIGHASGVTEGGGKTQVAATSSDFSAYREKLAGAVAQQKPLNTNSKQGSTGKIETKVEDASSTLNPSGDKLKLTKPGDLNAGAAAGGTDKNTVAVEANKKIAELEKNIADLKAQLEIRNATLAKSQQAAQVPVVPPKAEAPLVSQPAPAEIVEKPVLKTDENKPAIDLTSPPVLEKPVTPAPTPVAVDTPKPPPAVMPKAPVAKPVAAEPSFLENLLDNPLALGGIGALIAGGLAFLWLRRKEVDAGMGDSIMSVSTIGGHSLFAKTGGQNVDTSNVTATGHTSVFSSSFNPSASQLDANEVDPIAEADVYIAYGRDLQAEEILKEALRTNPDRHAVRVKLLEIYATRQDARSFEMVAGELYAMTKGEGEEWSRVVALGAGIDPSNPLYAGGTVSPEVAARIESLTAPTEPLMLNINGEGPALDSTYKAPVSISPVAESPAQTSAAESTSDQPALDADTVDFDLDLPPQQTAAQEDEPEEISLEFEPSRPAPWADSVIRFDPPPLVDVKPVSSEGAAPFSLSDTNDDENEPLDLSQDFRPSQFGKIDADEAPSLKMPVDLSKISLSLEPTEPLNFEPTIGAAVIRHEGMLDLPTLGSEESFDLTDEAQPEVGPASMIGTDSGFIKTQKMVARPELAPADPAKPRPLIDVEEMTTKLELAEAYAEMGESEGARELLEEVIENGSQNQADKAQAMLARLS